VRRSTGADFVGPDFDAGDAELDEAVSPATDLMVTLVAVLVVLLFITRSTLVDQHERLEAIQSSQMTMIESAERSFGVTATSEPPFTWHLTLDDGRRINIINDVTSQRFQFGDGVVFAFGEDELQRTGRAILDRFYATIRPDLGRLQEIKIEGHADCRVRTVTPSGENPQDVNLRFAANRALAVYRYLVEVGIDPKQSLISASSFGAELPVTRRVGERFPLDETNCAGLPEEVHTRNRRIEVVLIYR
jgi:outer membrane protein OmpA-like peptidoglycan-associated protein